MDIFATKGIEYLLVIAYLLLLVPFWWLLRWIAPAPVPVPAPRRRSRSTGMADWFRIPEGFHFHRGHTWARPEGGGVFRVGMDDFAHKLLGAPDALLLPALGERVEQGEPGWRLEVDGHTLKLLSPVGGEVVAVNEDAARSPRSMAGDPYGRGWLLKVRAGGGAAVLKNLLPARLARAWTEEAAERVGAWMGGGLGVVLQDGGVAVSGFGRQTGDGNWHEVAAELLMTAEPSAEEPSVRERVGGA